MTADRQALEESVHQVLYRYSTIDGRLECQHTREAFQVRLTQRIEVRLDLGG